MAAPATVEQMEKLRPYFAGEASPTGETDSYCPMHDDNNRSAQINTDKGVWKCHACGAGGTIAQLVESEGYWIPLEGRTLNGNGKTRRQPSNSPEPMPTIKDLRRWHESLMADEDGAGERIHRLRGLTRPTAIKFMLGWDGKRRVYTIPVRSIRGKLWNVRRWTPEPANGGRKIWGIKGHNECRLFPAAALTPWDLPIIICGGEWDAIINMQEIKIPTVTRTGAEHVWNESWNEYFANREVYLCHDMDETGKIANGKIRKELETIATSTKIIELPYPYRMKHGNDLNDFWLDGGTPAKFQELMRYAS